MKVIANKFITVSILIITNTSYAGEKDNFMDPFCLSCKSRPKPDTKKNNKIKKSSLDIVQTSYDNQNEIQNMDKNNARKSVIKSTTNNKQKDTSEIQVVNESKQLQDLNENQECNIFNISQEHIFDLKDCNVSFNSINSYKNPDCYFKDNILNLSMNHNEFQDDISKKCYSNLTQKESSFQNNNSIYLKNNGTLHPTKNNNNELFIDNEEDNRTDNILGQKRRREPIEKHLGITKNVSKKTHDKFEKNNCIRKIKTYVLKEICKFINSKIREAHKNKPNSNNEMKMIDKKKCKDYTNVDIFIPKTIEEIFSANVNDKFVKIQKDHNKNLFKKLKDDNNVEVLKFLNKKYIEYLKYFSGNSNDEELKGMGRIDDCRKEISGEDEEYFDYIKRFLTYLIAKGKNSSHKK